MNFDAEASTPNRTRRRSTGLNVFSLQVFGFALCLEVEASQLRAMASLPCSRLNLDSRGFSSKRSLVSQYVSAYFITTSSPPITACVLLVQSFFVGRAAGIRSLPSTSYP